jgi:hypothetical protein
MLDAHVSQFYEWLPWHDGTLAQVPKDPVARKAWLKDQRERDMSPSVRAALEKWYGAEKAKGVTAAEAFEICEYGTRPDDAMVRRLFPFMR